ncbi:MAG: hypothetical protein LBJ00_06145 [Planctomycetaceae bacterium]|nr:hypothetical protein [Planctomycetaceae bacterium]
MKVHQLATTPDFENGLLHARWLNTIVVEFELFFGIWLLSGLLQQLTWLVSLILFIDFAGISLYKAAVLHDVSCGCFSAAQVNPWITMVLDIIIIGLLITFRPKDITFRWQTFFHEVVGLRFNKRLFAVVGVWFGLLLQRQ